MVHFFILSRARIAFFFPFYFPPLFVVSSYFMDSLSLLVYSLQWSFFSRGSPRQFVPRGAFYRDNCSIYRYRKFLRRKLLVANTGDYPRFRSRPRWGMHGPTVGLTGPPGNRFDYLATKASISMGKSRSTFLFFPRTLPSSDVKYLSRIKFFFALNSRKLWET